MAIAGLKILNVSNNTSPILFGEESDILFIAENGSQDDIAMEPHSQSL